MKDFLSNALGLLAVSGLLFFSSCSDDDDDGGVINQITFDGTTYDPARGFIVDYGANGGYLNYDFYITDGNVDVDNETFIDATILVYLELFSPDVNNFQTGVYTYDASANPGDSRHFDTAAVLIDENENGELDQAEYNPVTGGTVEVRGDPYTYTVTFNLTVSGGRSLQGAFSGEFDYEQDDERFPDGQNLRKNLLFLKK